MDNNIFKIKTNQLDKYQSIPRLLSGSDSLFISELYHCNQKKPLLIITNDSYTSKRIFQELNLFAPQLKVAIFPDREILAYEKISPQKDLIAERLRVLWQISHQQLDITIIHANTLQARLCPVEYLYQRVFVLKVNNNLSILDLKNKLLHGDYSLVEQVFEPGEFAIRGNIVDILPMGYKHIIRIELFDNEIESIRVLDKKNKQLINNVDYFELIPAYEYPTDQESLKTIIPKFIKHFSHNTNSHLLQEFKNNILPAGTEYYLPLFFDKSSTFFDYLDESLWQILYWKNLSTILNINWQEISKRYEHFNTQYPCLKPEELFLDTDSILNKINKYQYFQLTQDGELYKDISQIPDITINNKDKNPLYKFLQWKESFTGVIIFVIDSLGRLEIIRQTLERHSINTQFIQDDQYTNQGIKQLQSLNQKAVYLIKSTLFDGFIFNNLAFITEANLYNLTLSDSIFSTRKNKNIATHPSYNLKNNTIQDINEIQVGDFVVHINHGIGKYLGLTTQSIANIEYDMLELEYQDKSKLFIPTQNIHLISRYSKINNSDIQVSKLGSNTWKKIKEKTEKKINDIAVELLDLYAKRETQTGIQYTLPIEYTEFANSFGYEPTPDQNSSFEAIIKDMTSIKPMDRLICGDVGFGKTEVVFRAAFIAAMNNTQVAVLTPTTLLTEQHYQNFVNRFAGFPLQIAEISRFKTKKEILITLELVKSGKIDILIGTHRLLQNDVQFANLGLIIIDEEHRFGVKQKEKLKQLRTNVDILSLTATPIPRTLSMALDGIRDFSIIATPPKRRLAINTIISNDDDSLLREAISREIRRGGQVFFLYNDVINIPNIYERLTKLMPEIHIGIAHGQMNESLLEQTIWDFIKQRYNLLLCSTIIETGIDIANANTIIIYRADKLGLSQLHQLRGRVGRSHHQAYCYLIVPENQTKDAEKRLEAISKTSELGSGFNLALHDLEIRGAGEILGDNQSGDIKDIGLTLYTEMLRKAVTNLKSQYLINNSDNNHSQAINIHCEINLNTTCIIPKEFCPDIHKRLLYYKRLSNTSTIEEIDLIYQDIMDNYGIAPTTVLDLINSHYLRIKAIKLHIQKLDISDKQIIVAFIANPPIEPIKIIKLLQKLHTCKYDKDNKLIWQIKSANTTEKLKNANLILDELKYN